MIKEQEATSPKPKARNKKLEAGSKKQATTDEPILLYSALHPCFLLLASCFFGLTAVAADEPQSQAE